MIKFKIKIELSNSHQKKNYKFLLKFIQGIRLQFECLGKSFLGMDIYCLVCPGKKSLKIHALCSHSNFLLIYVLSFGFLFKVSNI